MTSDPVGKEGGLLVPHLLYGSFRRESRGYRTVCRSPGLGEAHVRTAEASCNGWGGHMETDFRSAVVHEAVTIPASSGGAEDWYLAIRVTNLGTDHKLRSGALSYHVVFFDEETYARVGFEPFRLESSGAFIPDWDDRESWPPLLMKPEVCEAVAAGDVPQDRMSALREQLLHLLAGHRLRFAGRLPTAASDAHVTLLFRLMPWSWRRRVAVATFTSNRRRKYALAVEHSQSESVDPWRPEPLPALPPDMPAAVSGYADAILDALSRRDAARIEELARTADPIAATPGTQIKPRSTFARLFHRK